MRLHDHDRSERIGHHMRVGWHGLLIFGALGTLLEILHAWKNPAYLGVGNEMRRLMWTLAHAHGIGLSLLQLGFAATLHVMFERLSPRLRRASRLLDLSTLLMPLGFFLGGAMTYKSDPGLGVILVPIGALAFLGSAFFTALDLPGVGGGIAHDGGGSGSEGSDAGQRAANAAVSGDIAARAAARSGAPDARGANDAPSFDKQSTPPKI